ncbi:uncharacterized protein SOCEGT47_074650 [Sorangium cellulosum]|uniref:Thioesterase domain-containing protein n=1 Tax=Sorangium cellulosum TaxID=56 RepID=A0A4P2QB76_SORCE|nr:PaaI family thioesterase [Sorangium cellulosum]AUX26895.1 uncharacterized protein SOCEGT47_074650 [Sorangium cellulosum]
MRQAIPRSKTCFACGTEQEVGLGLAFEAIAPGHVAAVWLVLERFAGHPTLAHGGVLAAALDEAFGAVIWSLDPNRFMVTAELSLRYIAPVRVGQRVRCEARIVEHHRWLGRCAGSIALEDGTIAVTATGTLATQRR